jgi:hypothetical protein
VSDWILFTWDKAVDHLLHIYMADNGTQYIRRKNGASSELLATSYDTTPGGDRTLEQTIESEGTTVNVPFLTKVEVY